MKRHKYRTLSLLLALCMLLSGLPWAPTVVAVESGVQPGETIENEESLQNDEITIVEEDLSLRGEYEKHFLMSDGTYQAVVYSYPVHELVDGAWVEIENPNPNARGSVTTDNAKQNIIDNYVLQGAGVQDKSKDRLYIGNRSAGLTRAYIRFATMPTIPAGAIITDAFMSLTFTNGTDTAANASAYMVTGGYWESGTITWDNMPAAAIALATNISHNNLTGYTFSCKKAVQTWYSDNVTGSNANYGIMIRYHNESISDYNAIYSADCSDETKRPSLTITYQLPTEIIDDGVFYIKNVSTGLYLGTYGSSSDYASVKLLGYSSDGISQVNQLWSVRHLGNGYYTIRPIYKPDMLLHVTSSVVDITKGILDDNLEYIHANQCWTITPVSGGYSLNYGGTNGLIMRSASGAPSPGLGVITGIDSGASNNSVWSIIKLSPPTNSDYLLNVEFSFDYKAVSDLGPSEELSKAIINRNFLCVANAYAQKCGIYLINHQDTLTPYLSDADKCPNIGLDGLCKCLPDEECTLLSGDDPFLNYSSVGFQTSVHCTSIIRLRNNLIVEIPPNTIRVAQTGHQACYYSYADTHTKMGGVSSGDYPVVCIGNDPTNSRKSPSTLAHEIAHIFGVNHHDIEEDVKCIMVTGLNRDFFKADDIDTYFCDECIAQIISQKNKY